MSVKQLFQVYKRLPYKSIGGFARARVKPLSMRVVDTRFYDTIDNARDNSVESSPVEMEQDLAETPGPSSLSSPLPPLESARARGVKRRKREETSDDDDNDEDNDDDDDDGDNSDQMDSSEDLEEDSDEGYLMMDQQLVGQGKRAKKANHPSKKRPKRSRGRSKKNIKKKKKGKSCGGGGGGGSGKNQRRGQRRGFAKKYRDKYASDLFSQF